MGNATRILPSQQAKGLDRGPITGKAKFLDWFSCEFGGSDGVQATVSPLSAEETNGEAGLLISAVGVRKYFRFLVWVRPSDLEPGRELTVRARVKVSSSDAPATLALAYRDPAKGWTFFAGQSKQILLSSEWRLVTATFAASAPTTDVPVAVMFHLGNDVQLHIAQLELASGNATGIAGTISSEPAQPEVPSVTNGVHHSLQVVSETISHITYLVRRLRFGEAAKEVASSVVAVADGVEVPADVQVESIDRDTLRVTAARTRQRRTLYLIDSASGERSLLGEVTRFELFLLGSELKYSRNTLTAAVTFRAETAIELSHVAFDLVVGGLVLHRGLLKRDGNDYRLLMAVPCSRQTASQPISLHAAELGSTWPLALETGTVEAPIAPDLVPLADVVEGSFDGISFSRNGALVATGWCRDPTKPDEAVVVDLMVEGSILSSGVASSRRADVAGRRGGSAVCGFNIEIPPNLACGESLTFEIRPRAKAVNIKTAARTVTLAPNGRMVGERSTDLSPKFRTPSRGTVQPTYAGIILTQDGAPVLLDLLRSLERFELHTFRRLVVIDHQSTDDTRDVVRSFEQRLPIELVSRPPTSSFSESNNFAARMCDEDILVFLNNDLVFTSAVIHELGSHLHDGVGVAGLKLLDPKVPNSRMGLQAQQHVGIHFASRTNRDVRPFESRVLTDAPPANHAAIEAPAVTAALAAMERSFFSELGGFDEAYFYGLEDVDLCLRSMSAGRACVSVNSASAVHVRGYSRRTMPPHILGRRSRNSQTLLDRWSYTLCRSMVRDLLSPTGFWTGRRINLGFVVTAADPETSAGDYMTALDFARAFTRQFPSKTFFFEKSSRIDATSLDVLIVMVDDFNLSEIVNVAPSTLLVAWPRNWFHRWAVRPWRERFDYWFASSDIAAQYLEKELGRKVGIIPIGTDAQRFADGHFDATLEADVTFTGHYWGSPRDIMSALSADGFRLKIFGKGWEQVPQLKPYHAGALPYARMADVYKSTKIVVDDSNFATATWGSLNSRVFDALGAGALVLTNNAAGAKSHFGELLPTYSDRDSLSKLIHTYLENPELRAELVQKLQAKVLSEHTYAARVESFASALQRGPRTGLRIAIKIAAPSIEQSDGWGDWYFAVPLRRELEALGHHVRIDCLADWESNQTSRDDVSIVLRGLNAFKPNPRQINVMWLISHPNRVSLEELEQYDHVFVASRSFAERLARDALKPVQFLPQCTDAGAFFPPGEDAERNGVVFVGNSRLIMRPVIQAALSSDVRVDLYGDGWRGLVDEQLVKASVVPNELVGNIYRSAEIVLNDHWDDMRRWGFVSNRLFDAVACGATVVSDDVDGLSELFGATVRTFTDAETFRQAVDALHAAPPSRASRLAAAEQVLSAHTFKARARAIDEVVRTLDRERDRLVALQREAS
jgi:O-antigen biosynthesis protein